MKIVKFILIIYFNFAFIWNRKNIYLFRNEITKKLKMFVFLFINVNFKKNSAK